MPARGALRLTAVVAALAIVAAGCGEKKNKQTAPSVASAFDITVSGTPKKVTFKVPGTTPGGLTRIELRNDAKGKHALQVVRVDGDHKPQDALKRANAWIEKGKPLPGWIHPEGGVPPTNSGDTATSTQVLKAGKYFVLDTETKGAPKVGGTFTVEGSPSGHLPSTPAGIDMFEYGFKTSGLTANRLQVLIDNKGTQPHFVEAAPLKPGKTVADVKAFLKKEKGQPPVDFKNAIRTPVLDAKSRQIVEVEFAKKGNYALLCFVPDRNGGKPHAFKGMVAEAAVK
jgi:hypothetical protein